MATWIALLRGINVGKAKRIAMADLRALFEDLGYENVRTVLNSGNVVFEAAAAPAAAIEQAILAGTGHAVKVQVLKAKDLERAVKEVPFMPEDGSRFMLFFTERPADVQLAAALAGKDWGEDKVTLGQQVVYVSCPGGLLQSAAAEAVTKALGKATTARNWNTAIKLQAMCQ